MAFTFKLQTRDGSPADPPTLLTAAPSWRPGDTIPLGRRTLRVVEVRPGDVDLDRDPVLSTSTPIRRRSLTTDLKRAEPIAEAEAGQNRARPHRWRQEEAREAARLSRGEPREERAESVSPLLMRRSKGACASARSPILAQRRSSLRWLQRPRVRRARGGPRPQLRMRTRAGAVPVRAC